MKIAVIGSGVAGMAAAHYLHQSHDVHLYEADSRLGGHTATIAVQDGDEQLDIDTGFIVFNDWTYPNFIELLASLGVASQPSSMSFSVSDAVSGLEYAGSNLNTLFAQRRNLLSPRFLRLLRDILRFNRRVEADLASKPALADCTLGDYLQRYGYSREFRQWYLIPMGAAIWSSDDSTMEQFPLQFFVRFFRNHGLLNLRHRPQWRVIRGGSRNYIGPLTAGYAHNIRLATPVQAVQRGVQVDGRTQVAVHAERGTDYFDQVILACHSDQCLRLLADASAAEQSVLGAIPYTRNEVVLHHDTSLLPRNRRTWSSWNVGLGYGDGSRPTLTYNMNILQSLKSRKTWCVTLNQTAAIDPRMIRGVYHYEHPLFTVAGVAAQQRWQEVNGVNATWFCGAWWRNGFHEDAVWSAKRVATALAAAASGADKPVTPP
jgi:predicted NAD/FAD-binding protein